MIRRRPRYDGFTLVELLVSLAVTTLLLALAMHFMSQTGQAWRTLSSKVEQFREGRLALEAISARLRSATLNSYFGYEYSPETTNAGQIYVPTTSGRRSELRFISGPADTLIARANHPTHALFFTTPLGYTEDPAYTGLSNLLNICGYYIEWSNRDPDRPSLLPGTSPYRFRLIQFTQPAEQMTLYSDTSTSPPEYSFNMAPAWQKNALAASPNAARPLANNIAAMFVLPAKTLREVDISLIPEFTYDSESTSTDPKHSQRNRLPPLIRIILYSVDEAAAKKLEKFATLPDIYQSSGSPLFADPAKLFPSPADPGDLARFEDILNQQRLKYHRHETVVDLLPQPWSNNSY